MKRKTKNGSYTAHCIQLEDYYDEMFASAKKDGTSKVDFMKNALDHYKSEMSGNEPFFLRESVRIKMLKDVNTDIRSAKVELNSLKAKVKLERTKLKKIA